VSQELYNRTPRYTARFAALPTNHQKQLRTAPSRTLQRCTIPHKVLYKLCCESEFTARAVICHLTFYIFVEEDSIYMRSVNDVFKYNRARKNVIIGGAASLIRITALSCVSSFPICLAGFGDMLFIFQQALTLFAVVVAGGAFVWLV
jgi:hypothetical protein